VREALNPPTEAGWVLPDESTVRSVALHGGSVPEFDLGAITGRRAHNFNDRTENIRHNGDTTKMKQMHNKRAS